MRPFLKWVGGKRSILPELIKRIPPSYQTYHEPFFGGGALFFAIRPRKARLSDVNHRLVTAFRAVRDDVERLIGHLGEHQRLHGKSHYLEARRKLSSESDRTRLAALFVYLNRTCYNGLYRVNRAGAFNVPMGRYAQPRICDERNLRACSAALRGTDIRRCGFDSVPVRKGGFYYLDPPYHGTYDRYSPSGFGEAEHKKLAAFCKRIDREGGHFMLSNSDTPLVRELYQGYNVEVVRASRSVSRKAGQRGRESELIIRNYG